MCLIYAATVKKMVYTRLLEDSIMYNKSYISKNMYCILTMVKVLFVFTQFVVRLQLQHCNDKGVIIKKILCTVTNVFNLLHKIVKQLII